MKVTPTLLVVWSLMIYAAVAIGLCMGGYQDVPAGALLASLLHALMLHSLVWYYATCVCVEPRLLQTPGSFFIIVNLFYFGCTFLKYYRKSVYPELTSVLSERLLGSFLVFMSLLFLIRWWSWWSFRHQNHAILDLIRLGEFKSTQLLVLALAIACIVIINLYAWALFARWWTGLPPSRSLTIGSTIASTLLYPLFVTMFNLKKGALRNICYAVFILFGLWVLFSWSGRSTLAFFIFIAIPCQLFSWRFRPDIKNRIILSVLGLPLIIMAIAVPLTRYVKGDVYSELVQTLGRGELSDLAISICIEKNRFDFLDVLINNAQWATPGTYIDKEKLVYPEDVVYRANKWRSSDYRKGHTLATIDYMDTLFSFGAMIGGYVGVVLFPIFWVAAFTLFVDKCAGLFGVAAQICCISFLVRIENSPWELIVIWRDFLLITLMMYGLMKCVVLLCARFENVERHHMS